MKAIALSLLLGAMPIITVHADTEFGKFGAWSVSGSKAPNGMPICQMMEFTRDERDPTLAFMLMAGLPTTVALILLRPIGGLGATKGQPLTVFSTINKEVRSEHNYTVIDEGYVASGEATTAEMRGMVTDISRGQTWMWQIDVPAARIAKMRVPFEGFVDAAKALATCGVSIDVPF